MSPAASDQSRYEKALRRYFQIPAEERRPADREKILHMLGLPNPAEFLSMHIPLWEARLDELLDPASTDMLPISISHSYVNWVRGALKTMPPDARVRIFASKLKDTGLGKAILSLVNRVAKGEAEDFTVTGVELVEKVHKDTLFSVRDSAGRDFSFYLSRFGCLGEYIHAGLPPLVGLPALPVCYHLTPQGEEVLVKPKEEGFNIFLDNPTAARIRKDGAWWVQGAARQDALGDRIGSALRYGHYVATAGRQVVMIDNIELFHMEETDVRIFEPVYEFLPRRAFPDEERKARALRDEYKELYDAAYAEQSKRIRDEWGEVERYLTEMRRHVRTYTGEVFETVLAAVRVRIVGKK